MPISLFIFTNDNDSNKCPFNNKIFYGICEALWLLAVIFFVWAFYLFVVLLCLSGPDWHCDHLIGEEGAGSFAFHWFVMSTVHCNLLFLLVSLVGYGLWFLTLSGHLLNYSASTFRQNLNLSFISDWVKSHKFRSSILTWLAWCLCCQHEQTASLATQNAPSEDSVLEVIKLFFILNSAEHKICPATKSQITNNCKIFLAKHSWPWNFLC